MECVCRSTCMFTHLTLLVGVIVHWWAVLCMFLNVYVDSELYLCISVYVMGCAHLRVLLHSCASD